MPEDKKSDVRHRAVVTYQKVKHAWSPVERQRRMDENTAYDWAAEFARDDATLGKVETIYLDHYDHKAAAKASVTRDFKRRKSSHIIVKVVYQEAELNWVDKEVV